MKNNELYHYGVLGMRWGVRRYQPYGEGGYTPKDRLRKKVNSIRKEAGKWNEQTIKSGKDKENKSPAQVVTRETENIFRNASSILRRRKPKNNRTKTMTDDELKKVIARLKLENEYNGLVDESGRSAALAALDTLGDIAGITASLAVVAGTLYTMKKN